MDNLLIDNVHLVLPGERAGGGAILIEGDKISAVDPDESGVPADVERVDGRCKVLTPGLIDVHTHGIAKFSYEEDPGQLIEATGALSAYGTTCVLPTIIGSAEGDFATKYSRLAEAIVSVKDVCVPGLHLEGPFVQLPGAGLNPTSGDPALLEAMIDACYGRVVAMSISPEVENILPVIERLMERGIVPFITHTQATVDQTQAAIDAGARHATHFYDVFPVPPEKPMGVRPVGAVEAILADPRCTCDFIADGVHVHPTAMRATLAAKGHRGITIITDSSMGAGMPPGRYETPWGFPILVEPGRGARIDDPDHQLYGELAGSALTMNVGIANVLGWLDLPSEQVWAMGTSNPARLIGQGEKGRIAVGADADVVLWNDDLRPAATWVAGRCVYRSQN